MTEDLTITLKCSWCQFNFVMNESREVNYRHLKYSIHICWGLYLSHTLNPFYPRNILRFIQNQLVFFFFLETWMISQIYKDLPTEPLFLQNRDDELSKIFRQWSGLYVHILQEKISKKSKIYQEVLVIVIEIEIMMMTMW